MGIPGSGRLARACVVVTCTALLAGFAAGPAIADEPQPATAPTDSAEATVQAEALRQRLATLQERIDVLVREYADAQAALEGAAAAEVWAARRVADLERAQAEARAEAGRAARTLYIAGGAGGLYATALEGWSIAEVLDGVAVVDALVRGTTVAHRAAATAGDALAVADRRSQARRLTSEERVVLVRRSAEAAAEAQALQVDLDRQLAEADATVQRLLAEEEARRQEEARRAAEAAARAALAASGDDGPALPFEQLVDVLRRAGFDGDALRTAWAIVMRESGGRPGAVGSVNSNGTVDHGLFQLNDIHIGNYISADDLYDAGANAAAAFLMSRGGTDWGHWGLGETGWAGHLKRDIPAVYYALLAKWQAWYDAWPG